MVESTGGRMHGVSHATPVQVAVPLFFESKVAAAVRPWGQVIKRTSRQGEAQSKLTVVVP